MQVLSGTCRSAQRLYRKGSLKERSLRKADQLIRPANPANPVKCEFIRIYCFPIARGVKFRNCGWSGTHGQSKTQKGTEVCQPAPQELGNGGRKSSTHRNGLRRIIYYGCGNTVAVSGSHGFVDGHGDAVTSLDHSMGPSDCGIMSVWPCHQRF